MNSKLVARSLTLLIVVWTLTGSAIASEQRVTFAREAGRVRMEVGGKPLATYVYQDPKILRPYLTHVYAPNGTQVTRNHPPVEGVDTADHATMHPGIWMAFGDISGADFWRNKGRVEHVGFVEEPTAVAYGGQFVVRNRYLAGKKQVCEELCKIAVWVRPKTSIIVWDSRFSASHLFYFGDQEEMGLGVRVATPLAVKNGGMITNSDDLKNEEQVWGKPADWCDYSGTIDGQQVGVMLVPDPVNFRRSWFHARDYGVLVANPFGQKAFTGGQASRVAVPVNKSLRLRFAVVVHSGELDLSAAASDALTQLNATR